jgi:glycosyltransferase involved in cell wall biosynthesis
MALISVIMPTYNAEKWVADAIDSLSAQTYPNYELIVVDDGSQDQTLPAVRQKLSSDFKNKWQVLELGANRGPSPARNAGLRAASGSWVQFLDSDDFLAPRKFELQMAYCARAANSVAAVHSPWRRCYYEAGTIVWEGEQAEPKREVNAPVMCLVGGNRPLHSAGLARRDVLERIGGFDESLRFWECEEVNVRIAKIGRLELIETSDPCYLWRMHRGKNYIGGESARYRSTPVALGWIEQVLKAADNRSLDQLGLSDVERRDLLDDCTVWARLLYAHDRAAFRKFIAMARQFAPNIVPTNPKYASMIGHCFGYEAAEAVAKLARMPRVLARQMLQRLDLRPRDSVFDLH